MNEDIEEFQAEVQEDWSLVRKIMWMLKMPTPTFEDKEYEKKYYERMAKKYGIPEKPAEKEKRKK